MPRKKATKPKTEAKNNKFLVSVYNLEGKIVGEEELPKEIFGIKVNPSLLAQAVRVYLANKRLGTHKVKTRSEVSGSTRKIYRQKGTGRARHGDIKAPIFIGGGIAHGPRPKDYTLKLSKKMRRQALYGALAEKLREGKIKIIDGLEKITPKTQKMFSLMQKLNFVDKKGHILSTLLVLPQKLENVILAGRNLKNLNILPFSVLNSYEVLKVKNILLTKAVIKKFQNEDGKKTI